LKKYLALFLLLILSFFPIVNAQVISLGVEPTEVDLYLSPSNRQTWVDFKFFNPKGEVDAEYWLVPDKTLNEFINHDCVDNYWCDERNLIIVPKGTEKTKNPVHSRVLFKYNGKNFDGETSLFVYGRPVGSREEGTVSIQSRVKVRVRVHQTVPITTQISTTQNQNSGRNHFFNLLNPKTTTTIKTTTTVPQTIRETTTIIEESQSQPSPSQSVFNIMSYWWLIVIALVGIGIFLVFKFDLFPVFSPFVFLLLFLPMVHAKNVNVSVNVTPAPPPIPPYKMIVGILPTLTAIGIVLWFLKSIISSPRSTEELITLIVSIIVAIVLLGILVVTI